MSTGLTTGRRNLSRVLVLALAATALAALSGCGKGGENEDAAPEKPRAMVPGETSDTTVVDTAAAPATESAYVAGTLSDAAGVSTDSVPTEQAAPVTKADTRPSTSVTSNTGAFNLQLGSFTNLANARKQADRISELGYAPVIEESDLGGQTYHRVMLKGVGDMAEASRLGELIHSKLGIAYLVRRGN
ncbi:MAG: SPOR domain-containing protein [Candidatus Krumholzibacteriota bacterium]